MKSRKRLLLQLMTIGLTLQAGEGMAVEQQEDSISTEIILMGSISDLHLHHERYRAETLREIVSVCNADIILVPLSRISDTASRDIAPSDIRKIADLDPAIHVVAQVAQCNHTKMMCYGMPEGDSEVECDRYAERYDRANRGIQECLRWLEAQETPNKLDIGIIKLASHLAKSLEWYHSPQTVNFAGYDAAARDKYFMLHEILPGILRKYSQYESYAEMWDQLATTWRERNRTLAETIHDIAVDHVGQRLLVVTPAEQRYILCDYLSRYRDIAVKEYWNVDKAGRGRWATPQKPVQQRDKRSEEGPMAERVTMDQQYESEKQDDIIVEMKDRKKLRVGGGNGMIKVQTHESHSCLIAARIRSRASTRARAEDIAQSAKIIITELENEISVGHTECRLARGEELAVGFHIEVPHHTDVHITTCNGDVALAGAIGELFCKTSNGSISCENTTAKTELATNNGNIDITCTRENEHASHIRASTANGNIDVSGVKHLSAVVETETNNGALRCDVPVAIETCSDSKWQCKVGRADGVVRLKTSNGDISLR